MSDPAPDPADAGRGPYVCTPSGIQFFPLDARGEEIDLFDIAYLLANTPRWGGACKPGYSVAQHSVLVSCMVPSFAAMHGLLHDAAEAYLGDVQYRLKPHMREYREWEDRLLGVIWEELSEGWPWVPQEVKPSDVKVAEWEHRDLMPHPSWFPPKALPALPPLEVWDHTRARDAFLSRYDELLLDETFGGGKETRQVFRNPVTEDAHEVISPGLTD